MPNTKPMPLTPTIKIQISAIFAVTSKRFTQ